MDAGVTVVGKNVMDELAYSLGGDNAHYGTPINPKCPDRLPGGSSSGTAAAVSAGEADLGLGAWVGTAPGYCFGLWVSMPRHVGAAMQ